MTTFLGILVSLTSSGQSELLQKYLEVQHQRMHYNGVVLVTKNNRPLYRATIGKASHEMDGNPSFAIYPESALKFFGKKVNVNLTFKTDAAGNISGVEAAVSGQVHYFNKK